MAAGQTLERQNCGFDRCFGNGWVYVHGEVVPPPGDLPGRTVSGKAFSVKAEASGQPSSTPAAQLGRTPDAQRDSTQPRMHMYGHVGALKLPRCLV